MQVRYTFKIRGHLDVDRKWRYKRGNWTFQFHGTGDFASSISVTIAGVEKEHWPTVTEDPEPDIRAEIKIPDPHAAFVVAEVDTIAEYLGLFRVYEIETDAFRVDWIPEDLSEAEMLAIMSFERMFAAPSPSPIGPLPPDFIARCILSARHIQASRPPLRFFQHGVEDLVNRRYVEAFYDFYFVLETLFANGKTNHREVLKDYLRSAELCAAVDGLLSSREDLVELSSIDPVKARELAEPKDKAMILKFLIQTRGLLHHHHTKQSERRMQWNPNDQEAYHFASTLGKLLSFRICTKRLEPELWADDIDFNKVRVYAKEEEKLQIRFVYSGSVGGVQRHNQEAIIEVAGNRSKHGRPSAAQLLKAEEQFRSRFEGPGRYLISYETGPADGSRGRFSEYRAYVPDAGS